MVILGMSITFLGMIVTLRIAYKDRGIEGPLQTTIFELDVAQHHARAYIGDDAKDVEIANELLRLGFFSPIYTDAGLQMLQDKADAGYQPAIERLAELRN